MGLLNQRLNILMLLNKDNQTIEEKIKNIQFLLSDVDGVLTNGSLYIGSNGTEYKKFHVEDHAGIALFQFADINVGLLSARFSKATSIRAQEMNVNTCIQGALNKAKELKGICEKNNINEINIAYIGDGLIDIPILERVGFPYTVPDAHSKVIKVADYITKKRGGYGAFREVVEHILNSMGIYEKIYEKMQKQIYKV